MESGKKGGNSLRQMHLKFKDYFKNPFCHSEFSTSFTHHKKAAHNHSVASSLLHVILHGKLYPRKTCPCWSIARIDLHSEQRNRPAFVALSLFEQTGQPKIFGKGVSSTCAPFLKNDTESAILSLILKNWENPKSWNTS